MSNSIDKRIVEMQFNNKQFESGIQTSIKSLDRLKQNLNLEKAAKGLESLEKAGRSFNLSSMNDSITAISNRFSAMGIVGMTVLQNITNSAYNCAKRMMNILAVDPLKMGFSEYETQINSVQTILANTSSEMDKLGYDQQQRLDIVNQKLDELNVYADKTIYNFSEMTRNIGTFTAAGVELDTSVSSIKGIANLAAVSGSTSQQASTAMYQLSQAIATGTIRLMDWNSVVNAGMGGEVFQNALIRTASNMKVVGEDAQKMFAKLQAGEVSFRDSLSSGWLSSDILTATLSQIAMDFEQIAKANGLLLENGAADIESAKKLMRSSLIAEGYTDDEADEIINLAETATDAATKVKTLTQLFDTLKEAMQSGWTQSWEYIIGDFNEAKELLTSVSDYFGAIIGASADSRNAMLADWAELGGRNALIDSFWNIIYSIKNVTGTIRKAFEEFFPQTTGQQLFDITKKISDFTEKIKVATENSELMGRVSRVFRGVAAALDIVRTAAGWAWDGFKRLLEQTNGAAGGFLDFLAGIGDSVSGFRDAIKSSEALQGILNGLGNTAAAVYDMVAGGIKRIGTFFENLWTQIQGSGIFTRIGDFLTEVLGKIPEFIARIGEWGNSIINWVKSCETLKNAWNSVKGFFGPIISGIADFGKALWDGIQAFFGEDTNGEGFLDKIKVRFSAFGEKIGEWFETIGPKLKQDWENVRAFMTALFTKTIPQFFANLKMEAIQKWPWLERIFTFFEETWEKARETCGPILNRIREIGMQLWTAIKNLFGGENEPKESEMTFGESIRNIVSETWNKIKGFFSDFFLTTLPQWFEQFKGVDWGKIIKTALGIFSGVKLITAISGIGKLGSGLASIGEGLGGVGSLLKDIGKNGLTVTKVFKNKDSFATSLLKIAGSIAVMVGAIVVLSNMEAEKAWKGIGMLTLIAGELLLVTALFKKVDANGDALLKAAGAIALMVVPMYLLGHMDVETAIKGVLGIGIILTELALFMRIAGKGMSEKQSFIGLAISVNLLVLAVKGLGDMNTDDALRGVVGLGAVLLELSLFMNKTNTKNITGMISMALALNLMVRAVRKIGSLNSKTILKGVLGVAGIAAAFSVLVNSAKGVNFGSSIGALLLMAGSIILFIETFKQVEGANADSMVKFAVSLAMMMLSISVAMKIMSTIPITGALASVANFAIFIVGVGGIITALGWIQSEWSGMTSFLEEGGNVLGQIGTAIGKFAGGIAGGFMQGMNLPQIGTDLTDFMTNVQGFIDGAANIKSESLTGAQTLVGVIGSIAGTEFKNWLVNLFLGENPITKFSGDIVSLGKALTSYALAVLPMTLVPQTVIDRSVSVATALASVAKQIPATGGILSVINGIGDMSTFSTNIKSLGSGLTDFGIEISKIDDSKFNQTKIDAVIAVANGLAALEEGLEGQGGLEDKIEGVKSLSKFSEGIEPFGLGINKFITEANKIIFDPKTDQEKIEAVIAIGNALRVLETGLEGQGGLEDKIEGIKSLSKFSEGMEPFAEGLNSFISQVRLIDYDPDIDGARLYAVMDIGKALADLENSVQAQGGWVDAILGIKSLSAFGGEMPDFATGLNNFITQVSALEDDKYDADKIEKVLAVAAAINELNHALPATDGFIQGILGTQDLGLFSENIKKVGEALSSFSTNVAGSTINKAESAVSALEVIRTFTSTLKQEGGLWNDIGKFFGGSQENTLLGYAANMRKIGEDLNIFSTNIEDVKIDNIGKASGVVEAIGEFIETLSVSGGVFEVLGSFFKGNKTATLEAMSTQMGNFGTEIGKLATGISNIETTQTNFNGAKILFDSFRTFYSAVEEVGEISYTGNMNDLLWTLDDFGVSLAAFSTNLGTTDISTLSSATAIIETLTTLASSAAGINPDNVGTIGAILEEFGKLNMSSFVTAFAESSGEAVLAVAGLISQIRTTIQNDTTVGAACATLSQRGVTALRLTWIDWFTAGSYLGRGMGSGITSATGFIRTAAVNAARSAISAVRVTWDEHSPSKVGAELGQFWDMGLAGGIDRYGYLIGQSAADVSSDAIRSAQSVLNDMSHIGSDIDSNFTIRPVMDLTDILNGMNDIDGLFSGERTIASGYFNGLTGIRSARAFASEQGRITAMTDNGDIVNELVMLEKKLDELSESVRNMKIVLDTGVVVGEITEGVDENLGVLAGRRERGN